MQAWPRGKCINRPIHSSWPINDECVNARAKTSNLHGREKQTQHRRRYYQMYRHRRQILSRSLEMGAFLTTSTSKHIRPQNIQPSANKKGCLLTFTICWREIFTSFGIICFFSAVKCLCCVHTAFAYFFKLGYSIELWSWMHNPWDPHARMHLFFLRMPTLAKVECSTLVTVP